MSNIAVVLEAAVPGAANWEADEASGLMTTVKAKILKFLNKLPDHFDDVDPMTFRRLPVPY